VAAISSTVDLVTTAVTELNRELMAGFQEWLFLPGMRFAEKEAWWDESKKRQIAREVVDLKEK
ncbi:MAG: hypothetical protein GQ559_09970, partial [Desulfobulbaceae bacterium]|nr:hypothetical protein [Desulfobulbaceae bacterium]